MQLLGHKGDLMVIAFRRSFDELGRFELALSRTKLFRYLESTTSYVSIVELGMYEMTAKIHRTLAEQGLTHGTDAYNAGFDAGDGRGSSSECQGGCFTAMPRRDTSASIR